MEAQRTDPGIEPWVDPCVPIDIDELAERIEDSLGAASSKGRRPPSSAKPEVAEDGHEAKPCPEPVELILYVSAHSTHSAAAVRTVKQVLTRFQRSRVRLTVRDLTDDPTLGAADNVAFTPTLVRRSPSPRTFILGHLSNPAVLIDLLADCEEDES